MVAAATDVHARRSAAKWRQFELTGFLRPQTACNSHFEITYEILILLSNYRYKYGKFRLDSVAICDPWFESHLHYIFWLLLWSLSSRGYLEIGPRKEPTFAKKRGSLVPNRRQFGQKSTELPPKVGIYIGKVGSLGRFC